MRYELEKVRRYFYGKDDVFTVIKESDSLQELETLTEKTKLRVGKTFHETLVINEWDKEHVDIVQVIFQKDSEYDWDWKTDKRKVSRAKQLKFVGVPDYINENVIAEIKVGVSKENLEQLESYLMCDPKVKSANIRDKYGNILVWMVKK